MATKNTRPRAICNCLPPNMAQGKDERFIEFVPAVWDKAGEAIRPGDWVYNRDSYESNPEAQQAQFHD